MTDQPKPKPHKQVIAVDPGNPPGVYIVLSESMTSSIPYIEPELAQRIIDTARIIEDSVARQVGGAPHNGRTRWITFSIMDVPWDSFKRIRGTLTVGEGVIADRRYGIKRLDYAREEIQINFFCHELPDEVKAPAYKGEPSYVVTHQP